MFYLYFLFLSLSKPELFLYTGGSNTMGISIYKDFIYSLNKQNIIVNKVNFFDDDNNDYNNINNNNLLGHSSGCVTLLNNCKNAKKIILLDPVKTPTFKNVDLSHLEKVLIINAEKSYKWSDRPPFVPFIPFFEISSKDLNIDKSKIEIINFKFFGHTDIINNPYRNLMHYSGISVGYKKRKKKYIDTYHYILSKIIYNFLL